MAFWSHSVRRRHRPLPADHCPRRARYTPGKTCRTGLASGGTGLVQPKLRLLATHVRNYQATVRRQDSDN